MKFRVELRGSGMLAKVFLDFVILLNILLPGKYNCARLTFSDRILLSNFTKILTKINLETSFNMLVRVFRK